MVYSSLRRMALTTLILLGLLTAPAYAGNQQSPGTLLVPSGAWLQGSGVINKNGVDVYANGDTSLVSGNYSAPAVGMKWQCIELAQRLYQQKGWASGQWGVSAWQVYGLKTFGFQSHPNNGSYLPVPGDLIVHAATPAWPNGHVSIVDSVNGATVNVVEQNVAGSNGRGVYAYNSGGLSRAGFGPILGIVHSPSNPNSNTSVNHDPFGSIDAVEAQRGGVRIAGWTLDPDASRTPIWIHVYIDGEFQEAFQANGYRSDIAAAFPSDGGSHAFDTVIPYFWGGQHTVAIYAINVGEGTDNPSLGSRLARINYDYAQQGTVQGDFTGDGKTDVAAFYDYGGRAKIFSFTGNGLGGLSDPYQAWDSGAGNWDWSYSKPFTADFNGDGRADIGVLYNYGNERSKLFIFPSNGSGFNAPYVAWDSGVGNFDWDRAMVVAGDFNGDGRADVAAFYNYEGRSKIWVFSGNGEGGFTIPAAPAWDSGPGNWEWERTKLAVGDFNRDGTTDIAALYNYDNSRSKIYTFLSAGTTFNPPYMAWDSGIGNWDWNRTDFIAGDFNGDGVADVAGMYDYSGETKLWLFAGNGSGGIEPPTLDWDWWRNLPYTGDFNGNGKTDIGTFYNYDNGQTKQFIFTSSGIDFTPSTVWDSGLGSWEWGHILVG